MDDEDLIKPMTFVSEHDAFEEKINDLRNSNQLFVVLKLLEQLQLSLPDKSTVQSTFNLISQILPALGNVASKENLVDLSRRIGAIETNIGKISQTSALNDKEVQGLKEGQASIRQILKDETGRLERSLDERKRDLDRQLEASNSDIKALHTAIDTLVKEVGAVRAESDREVQGLKEGLKEGQADIRQILRQETGRLEKASDDRKRDLDRQLDSSNSDIRALRGAIDTLVKEVGAVRAENGRYLTTTIIAIILFVISVFSFFMKPIVDFANSKVNQGVQNTSLQNTPNMPPSNSIQPQPAPTQTP